MRTWLWRKLKHQRSNTGIPAYLQLALKSEAQTGDENCELGSYCEYVNRIAITADLNIKHEEWAYRLCDKARRDSLAERSHSSGESPDLSLRSVQSNKQVLYEQIEDICWTITSHTQSFDRSIELKPTENTIDKTKVIQTVMVRDWQHCDYNRYSNTHNKKTGTTQLGKNIWVSSISNRTL